MRWYTRKGDEDFNREVDEQLMRMSDEVADAVGPVFLALILGGGYGREEGACVLRDGKQSLYNDLDLFLITKEPYSLTTSVNTVQKKYEHLLGIDVDIGAPLTVGQLQNLPNQLMWHDLLNGHHVLKGPDDIITANMPAHMKKNVPQVESIRLALNRGSGLMQAVMASHNGKLSDPDFIRRNYFKAALAFGDCATITHQVYTVHLPDRLARLQSVKERLPENLADEVENLYAQAITFKQSPDTYDREQTSQEILLHAAGIWVELFIYCERIRTGIDFTDGKAYVSASFIREPDQHRGRNLVRNIVKNLKMGKLSFRYPREGLYRELITLLTSPAPEDEGWMRRAEAFLTLWETYN